VRLAMAREAGAPTLLVRRGVRPGGLAPREHLTRLTWSLDLPAVSSEVPGGATGAVNTS
jgi:hypothetical protein